MYIMIDPGFWAGGLVWAIVWGLITNAIIHRKGYDENWFWWGFFFTFLAAIVAATKPKNQKAVKGKKSVPRWILYSIRDDTLKIYDSQLEYFDNQQSRLYILYYQELEKAEIRETETEIILSLYTINGKIAIPFSSEMKDAHIVKNFIQTRIQEESSKKVIGHEPLVVEHVTTDEKSIPDEIRKLKQLLDEEAISQEEYDRLKSRLLDQF